MTAQKHALYSDDPYLFNFEYFYSDLHRQEGEDTLHTSCAKMIPPPTLTLGTAYESRSSLAYT